VRANKQVTSPGEGLIDLLDQFELDDPDATKAAVVCAGGREEASEGSVALVDELVPCAKMAVMAEPSTRLPLMTTTSNQ